MYLFDRRRNLDNVRPDGAFRDLGRMMYLQVCGPAVGGLLHRGSLWFEVCLVERLCVWMISIYNHKRYKGRSVS